MREQSDFVKTMQLLHPEWNYNPDKRKQRVDNRKNHNSKKNNYIDTRKSHRSKKEIARTDARRKIKELEKEQRELRELHNKAVLRLRELEGNNG